MKRIKILFSLVAFLAFIVSCNREEDSSTDGFGIISFRNIGVNSEVVSTLPDSRGSESLSGSDGDYMGNASDDNSGDTDVTLDPVEEAAKRGFKLSVMSHGETVYACSDYDKYISGECEDVELRVGKYTVVADLGNPDIEGFEEPYYSGSEEVNLKKGDNVAVDIECKLANSILKIDYTDNFKNYFSAYSASVTTSKGNSIEYAQDETRGAYMASGEVTVYVKAKKSGANETTFNVGKYTLNPQYEYSLTLDVDVSKAIMSVTFSENVNEESLKIDVSDEALNANPPYITGEGVVSGEEFSIVEGVTLDETLRAIVNAEAEIAACELVTSSEYLIEKGWKENIDLVSADEQTISAVKNSGVEVKGFSGVIGKMAYVDFTGLVSTLPKDYPVDIRLKVTDKFGKVSEEFQFLASTRDCMFGVSSTDYEAPFLGNECKVNVTLLEGDVNNVKFALAEGGQELSIKDVSEPTEINGVNQYTLTLKGNDEIEFINPFKVNAKYLSYSKTTDTDLKVSYGIMLDDGEGDVWAKRAYLHVYNDDMQNLKVQKKETGGNWTDLNSQDVEISGTDIIAKGLTSNTQQQLRVVKEGKEPTNEVDIKTEEELQVPNAGFEEWYSKMVWEKTIFLSGGEKIYSYYMHNEADSDIWWDTNNSLTTQSRSGVASWYYCAYPTVMPTNATEVHTASWHVKNHGNISDYGVSQMTNDVPYKNSASVEISSVGYGANNWTSASSAQGDCEFRSAGCLFIGTYDVNSGMNLGHSFNSRPSKLKFAYKFYPYNAEKAKVYAIIYDADKQQIGYGEVLIANASDEYVEDSIVEINYDEKRQKAYYITVVFMSSSEQNPATKAIQGSKGAFNAGYGDSRHVGSILTVDDVQLIYE